MANTGLTPESYFPAELIDLVIDQNHSNVQALQASALVSKQWTPASRYHLFSDVTISHDNAREFIELLLSPKCTFASAIRRLTIAFVPGSQRWFGEFSRRLFSNEQVQVSRLRIQGSPSTIIRDEIFGTLSMYFSQVKELNFGPVVVQSFAQFSTFLGTFQALETFSSSCIFQDYNQPTSVHFNAPLRQVNLESPSTNVVLDFFYNLGILPVISALSLSYHRVISHDVLVKYLATRNDNLQTLAILIDGNVSGAAMGQFIEALDLSGLQALRALRVETNPPLSPIQAYQLLSRVNSVQFMNLEISVGLVQGIAGLDILLSGAQYPSLKKVKMIGSTWANIRQALPRCDMKDILQPN